MKNFSINANGDHFRLTEAEAKEWSEDVVKYILASAKDGYVFDLISIGNSITVWTQGPDGDYDDLRIGEAEFSLCQADAELAALAIVRELAMAGIAITLSPNDTGHGIPDIKAA